MSITFIRRPDGLGEPLGRYSHVAIASGDLIAIAGQAGVDVNGNVAPGGIKAQTRRTYENIAIALAAANVGLGDVIKTTTYLVGAEVLDDFMDGRAEVFADIFPTGVYPPNTLLIVSRLVKESLLVEIEALAVRPGESTTRPSGPEVSLTN